MMGIHYGWKVTENEIICHKVEIYFSKHRERGKQMINWLINYMGNLRDVLEMDSNSFYPMILTALGILCGIGSS